MRTGAFDYPLAADGRVRIHFAGHRAERVTPVAHLPADLMAIHGHRIAALLRNPPSPGWNGAERVGVKR